VRARWIPVAAVALAVLVSGGPASADLPQALRKARAATRAPAATAAVYRCGQQVWSGAVGVRSLRSRKRVSPNTPFIIASATKPVTAAMVLRLVDLGRLSLDTPVSTFYPKLPNASRITVRQLLNHTSGLAEYTENRKLKRRFARPRHRWTRREVLAVVRKPRFRPGARHDYTNTNYIVLGGILERAGGGRIERVFREGVATTAGLSASTFRYQPRRSRRFTESYYAGRRGSRKSAWARKVGIPSDAWGEVWTDGGLASTAPELARFGDALLRGRLLSAPLLAQMVQMGRNDYGLGLRPKRFRGRRWIGHDGIYGGYESEMWHDASRGLTIAVLTNLEEPAGARRTTSERIWDAVAAAYRGPDGACS
jgi:D-alanyl-D-alanine carboxypeptidase